MKEKYFKKAHEVLHLPDGRMAADLDGGWHISADVVEPGTPPEKVYGWPVDDYQLNDIINFRSPDHFPVRTALDFMKDFRPGDNTPEDVKSFYIQALSGELDPVTVFDLRKHLYWNVFGYLTGKGVDSEMATFAARSTLLEYYDQDEDGYLCQAVKALAFSIAVRDYGAPWGTYIATNDPIPTDHVRPKDIQV